MKFFKRNLLLVLLFFMINHPITAQNNNIKSSINFVPQWAKEVVWYQIFPDRFYNGDIKMIQRLKL